MPYILARGVQVTYPAINLGPYTATLPIGSTHTLYSTVTTSSPAPGTPVPGVTVTFTVISGPNTGVTGTGITNASGQATFTYLGSAVGTDTIKATFVDSSGTHTSNLVTATWITPPPSCTASGGIPLTHGVELTGQTGSRLYSYCATKPFWSITAVRAPGYDHLLLKKQPTGPAVAHGQWVRGHVDFVGVDSNVGRAPVNTVYYPKAGVSAGQPWVVELDANADTLPCCSIPISQTMGLNDLVFAADVYLAAGTPYTIKLTPVRPSTARST